MLAALGFWLTREAVDLGLGRAVNPGSGFAFWWIGAVLIVIGAVIALTGFARRTPATEAGEEPARPWLALTAALATIVYAVALPFLGFIPASIVLLFLLFTSVGGLKVLPAAGLAPVATLVAWAIFAKGLGSPLPAGLLVGTALG